MCTEMDASKSYGKMYEEVSVKHKKVKQALVRFRNLVDELLLHQYKVYQSGNSKVKTKALMEAATLMKREHRWENTEKRVGHILTSVTTFNIVLNSMSLASNGFFGEVLIIWEWAGTYEARTLESLAVSGVRYTSVSVSVLHRLELVGPKHFCNGLLW